MKNNAPSKDVVLGRILILLERSSRSRSALRGSGTLSSAMNAQPRDIEPFFVVPS
jgi:hypothetical protein